MTFHFPVVTELANPMPVAYADAQFVPFYDNPDVALKIFDKYENSASYILYFPEFYPCFDEACTLKKQIVEQRIDQHEKMEQPYEEYGYYLYKVNGEHSSKNTLHASK